MARTQEWEKVGLIDYQAMEEDKKRLFAYSRAMEWVTRCMLCQGRPLTVLEFGCGTGALLGELAAVCSSARAKKLAHFCYCGVDVNITALTKCTERIIRLPTKFHRVTDLILGDMQDTKTVSGVKRALAAVATTTTAINPKNVSSFNVLLSEVVGHFASMEGLLVVLPTCRSLMSADYVSIPSLVCSFVTPLNTTSLRGQRLVKLDHRRDVSFAHSPFRLLQSTTGHFHPKARCFEQYSFMRATKVPSLPEHPKHGNPIYERQCTFTCTRAVNVDAVAVFMWIATAAILAPSAKAHFAQRRLLCSTMGCQRKSLINEPHCERHRHTERGGFPYGDTVATLQQVVPVFVVTNSGDQRDAGCHGRNWQPVLIGLARVYHLEVGDTIYIHTRVNVQTPSVPVYNMRVDCSNNTPSSISEFTALDLQGPTHSSTWKDVYPGFA